MREQQASNSEVQRVNRFLFRGSVSRELLSRLSFYPSTINRPTQLFFRSSKQVAKCIKLYHVFLQRLISILTCFSMKQIWPHIIQACQVLRKSFGILAKPSVPAETLVKYFGIVNCFHKNTEKFLNLWIWRAFTESEELKKLLKIRRGRSLDRCCGNQRRRWKSCVCDFGFANSDSGISSSNRKPDNLKLGSQKANRD